MDRRRIGRRKWIRTEEGDEDTSGLREGDGEGDQNERDRIRYHAIGEERVDASVRKTQAGSNNFEEAADGGDREEGEAFDAVKLVDAIETQADDGEFPERLDEVHDELEG